MANEDGHDQWWFCTRHMTVEPADTTCPGKDLLGPYATREEAAHALDKVDFRKVIYFGARDLIKRDTEHPVLGWPQRTLFSFLLRNSVKTMDHFTIPPENFVEIAREVRL